MAATTETTAGSTPLGNPVDRLREAFDRLGSQQKIAFMVTIAALIAVIHLLPQARQASEEGQQRLASRRYKQADDLGRLGQQVNESLASLRGCAEEL